MFRARSGSFRKIRCAQKDIVGLGINVHGFGAVLSCQRFAVASLSDESRWKMWTFPSRIEPPFGGPEYVLQYLGRYTHRVALCFSAKTRIRLGSNVNQALRLLAS